MLLWAWFKSPQGQWCCSGVIRLNADRFLSNTPKAVLIISTFLYTFCIKISSFISFTVKRHKWICYHNVPTFAGLHYLLHLQNFSLTWEWLTFSHPPPSTVDRIINIRELNSCLVADVCCCCTFLSAPGGERSTQGCRVKQRFSRRHYMLLHWKKQTSEHLPVPRNRHHQIKISIIDCGI